MGKSVAERFPTFTPRGRVRVLRRLARAPEGLRGAVREATGMPLARVARAIGERRSDVSICLGQLYGLVFPRIRTKLDVYLGLPEGSMDRLLRELEQ